MLSIEEFQQIINRPESSILDFKESFYNFLEDKELKNTAKFVKDVVSFTNTVRNETAYIIIGISEDSSNKRKNLKGIDIIVDDAILQDKVKDKVTPRPLFHFYLLSYNNMTFGILEFPIKKYPTPVSPTIKMKGLEIGKVYYRHGTTNSEATGYEIIRIYEWFKSLPEFSYINTLQDEIGTMLRKLTTGNEKLSVIISEMWSFSKKLGLEDLAEFCETELKEIKSLRKRIGQKKYSYRKQKFFITPLKFEINPYAHPSSSSIKAALEKNKDIIKREIFLSFNIIKIEEMLSRFAQNKNTLATINVNSKEMFGLDFDGDYPVYAYVFEDDIKSIYANIRQQAIDKLINI